MEVTFSTNDKVTIYPNEKGQKRMALLIKESYCIPRSEAVKKVLDKTDINGGYTDQLWCIIEDFGSMFFNGQKYFENTKIKINEQLKNY